MSEIEELHKLIPSLGAIYHLSKEELIARLSKVNLDTEGKTDDLRARLSTYMKETKFHKSPGKTQHQLRPEEKPDNNTKTIPASKEGDDEAITASNGEDADKGSTTPHPPSNTASPADQEIQQTHQLPRYPPVNEFDRLTREPSVRDWYYAAPGYVPPMFTTNPYPVNQPADLERLREENPHMFFSRPTVGREVNVMDTVRRWGLGFDGSGNAQEFFERITELNESYQIKNQEVIRALPEIFKGSALEWFRVNRSKLITWQTFEKAFLAYFLPTRYLNKLAKEPRP